MRSGLYSGLNSYQRRAAHAVDLLDITGRIGALSIAQVESTGFGWIDTEKVRQLPKRCLAQAFTGLGVRRGAVLLSISARLFTSHQDNTPNHGLSLNAVFGGY